MNRRELLISLGSAGLGAAAFAQPDSAAALAALERAARAEGRLHTLAMPEVWANWRDTWADLRRLYGIVHTDEDMNSADEIARMAAEGRNATVDMGDIGYEYAAVARGRGISRARKPATWGQIPAWAKDADGYWALAYTGTLAFAINRRRVGMKPPRSWRALFDGPYRVLIGEVGSAAQASAAVLAAAIALGGAENRLAPALERFARLQREGRLVTRNASVARFEQADVDVLLLWDFVALAYRERARNGADYEVLIPEDGSVVSGYMPIINRHAPHPSAAQLAHEYIFSDAGQLNLARGHARPIRLDRLELPDELRQRLLDAEQYGQARRVEPALWAWEARKLPRAWQAEVMRRDP